MMARVLSRAIISSNLLNSKYLRHPIKARNLIYLKSLFTCSGGMVQDELSGFCNLLAILRSTVKVKSELNIYYVLRQIICW